MGHGAVLPWAFEVFEVWLSWPVPLAWPAFASAAPAQAADGRARLLTVRFADTARRERVRRVNTNRAIMIGRAVKLELKFTVTATTAELQRPCARRVHVSSLSANNKIPTSSDAEWRS